MSEMQQHVQDAINHLIETDAERGLQITVYRRVELIVDAVAGIADRNYLAKAARSPSSPARRAAAAGRCT